MNKIVLTCPHCGSADIIHHGSMVWSVEQQEWAADTPYDDEPIVCQECDDEFFEAAEKVISA